MASSVLYSGWNDVLFAIRRQAALSGKQHWWVAGQMSGTSLDGVDTCLAELVLTPEGDLQQQAFVTLKKVHHWFVPYPKALKQRLLQLQTGQPVALQEVVALHYALGELYTQAFHNGYAQQAAKHPLPALPEVFVLGAHGQTVYHQPPQAGVIGQTFQLGELALLASSVPFPVVCDFRPGDVALGGQGAPLVPFADALLLANPKESRCVLNLGGIANITVLPATEGLQNFSVKTACMEGREEQFPGTRSAAKACRQNYITVRRRRGEALSSIAVTPEMPSSGLHASRFLEPFAMDTGPANMLLDKAAERLLNQPYDANGAVAATGTVCPEALAWLQAHPFYQQVPPKSTGRDDFGDVYWQQFRSQFAQLGAANTLATLTELTAWSVAEAYRCFVAPKLQGLNQGKVVSTWVVGGGGTANAFLMQRLQVQLQKVAKSVAECLQQATPVVLTHQQALGLNDSAKEALAFGLLAWANRLGVPNNLPSCTGASRFTGLGKQLG